MAFKLGGDDDAIEEVHDINVTPFIDVILVLLIIFMVAAPLATVDVKVDLPASTAQPQPRPDKPAFVSLSSDGQVSLGDRRVERPALGPALDALTNHDRDQRVFLRADKGVPYGDVMGVLNLLRGAGYLRVGLVGLDASATVPGAASGVAPGTAAP